MNFNKVIIIKTIEYIKKNGIESLKSEFGINVKEYDDLFVLNYDQIESPKTHPIVQECRSLMLDKQFNLVSRSFDRFFNFGENNTGENCNFSKCKIFEKLDGSLINVYHYNGNWNVSTRGTAFAESEVNGFGLSFKELVYKALNISTQEEFNSIFDGFGLKCKDFYTFIFEVTSRENRVVTHYDGYTLWLLAIRDNSDGMYFDRESFKEHSLKCGIKFPNEYYFKSIDDCMKAIEELKDLKEGYVVYENIGLSGIDEYVPVFKLKSPTYLAVHRLKGEGLTPKRIIDLVNMNEHEEYLTYFEDDRKYFEPYIKAYEVLFDDINFIWERYKTVRDQKDFAMYVKDLPFASILFRKRKDSEQSFLHLFNLQSDSYKRDLLEKIKNTI